MAITLGLVEAIDSNGVYVSMPGSRGVLRGPYRSLSTVAVGTTVLIAATDDGEQVVVGLASGGGATLNVMAFGATGDGTTDDTAAIQAAVDAAAGYATVLFPPGTYKTTTSITVPADSTLLGEPGATIKYSTAGPTPAQKGIVIEGSDVTLDGLTVTGPRDTAATVDSEWGIWAVGGSASDRLERITLRNLTVSMWGRACILLRWVSDFMISGCHVHDAGFQGIACMSVERGTAADNHIHDILCPSAWSSNGYGITFFHNLSNLTDDPVCTDIEVRGNVIRNVPTWDGIDFHSGTNITVSNNIVLGCKVGIDVSSVTGSTITRATVTGNVIDRMSDDESVMGYGIQVGGESGLPATGVTVSGNTVCGHYGMLLARSDGTVVSGNTFSECNVVGVALWEDNRGFVIAGNAFIDVWSELTGTRALHVYEPDNTGVIAGNVVRTGGRSATYINTYALDDDQGSAGGAEILISGNDFGTAGTPVSSSSGVSTQVGESGTLLGFYGTAPVAKPTVTGSRGGNAALASLLTQLANLGLITDSSS